MRGVESLEFCLLSTFQEPLMVTECPAIVEYIEITTPK